jgi:hypothetical protein
MTTSDSLIKQYFQYLIDTYGFFIDHEQYSPEIMGNTEIVYKSTQIGIRIIIDRGQVLVNIGNPSWPESDWFEFSDVVHYFSPEVKFIYAFQDNVQDEQIDVEAQIKRVARMCNQYCGPILRGDFSMQEQIRKIEEKRVAEMLRYFNSQSQGKRN